MQARSLSCACVHVPKLLQSMHHEPDGLVCEPLRETASGMTRGIECRAPVILSGMHKRLSNQCGTGAH